MTPQEIILSKSMPEPNSGCWIWLGLRGGLDNQYGRVQASVAGKRRYAHRFSYEAFKGPTHGMFVCHHCDTPICVNPDHLFLGTNADNARDMVRKGRHPYHDRVLTEGEVLSIFPLSRAGASTRRIAAHLGVSQNAVWQVLAGRTWKHVTRELIAA